MLTCCAGQPARWMHPAFGATSKVVAVRVHRFFWMSVHGREVKLILGLRSRVAYITELPAPSLPAKFAVRLCLRLRL